MLLSSQVSTKPGHHAATNWKLRKTHIGGRRTLRPPPPPRPVILMILGERELESRGRLWLAIDACDFVEALGGRDAAAVSVRWLVVGIFGGARNMCFPELLSPGQGTGEDTGRN